MQGVPDLPVDHEESPDTELLRSRTLNPIEPEFKMGSFLNSVGLGV